MSREGPGLLLRAFTSGKDAQVEAVIEVIAHADADILVLAGLDWDLGRQVAQLLADRLGYPYMLAERPMRGVESGLDLDGDGRLSEPEDRVGYARFAGQEGMAIFARWPLRLAHDHSATPWSDIGLGPPDRRLADLPLSSTAHWQIEVETPEGILTLLTWHATAPVFDGPDDRNGRRNHDEAAIWLDVVPEIVGPVVLAGFANLDPIDGDGRPQAIEALLGHARLQAVAPRSTGAVEAASRQGGTNRAHRGDPALDTVDWSDDGGPGNLRVDYILPSRDVQVHDTGVLWPPVGTGLAETVKSASRHRLVWIDLSLNPVSPAD